MRRGRHMPRCGRGPAEPPRLRAGGGLGHGPPGPPPHSGREPLRPAPRGPRWTASTSGDGEVVIGPLEPEAFREYSAPRRGYS
jgi:hypothetical protein